MLQTRQVQAAVTDDFNTMFKDCSLFGKLDVNQGYNHFVNWLQIPTRDNIQNVVGKLKI